MVLESLFTTKKIIEKPTYMLVLSVIISFTSIMLAYFIFPEYGGVVFPLLVTVGMAPIFYNIFNYDEKVEEKQAERKINKGFFQRHGETIWLFSLFFIGVFIVTFTVSLITPENIISSLFKPQLDSINFSKSISGNMINQNILNIIVFNNLKIMLFAFVLSLVLSTGALWILGWNASVLGVYFAGFIKNELFMEFASSTAGIFPHMPIELVAYFLAGLSGGILSAGLIREKHNFMSKEFRLVFRDSLLLFAFAVFAICIGAIIEVYV